MDYVGLIPGAAAAAMALLTMGLTGMPAYKRALIIVLTIIAVGATGVAQWWNLHMKEVEAARRTEILETIGKFIDEGQKLDDALKSSSAKSFQAKKITDWMQQTTDFLNPLGHSYVVRFLSDAGLETSLSPSGMAPSSERANYWRSMRNRLTRLHEFSAEYSGQLPKSKPNGF